MHNTTTYQISTHEKLSKEALEPAANAAKHPRTLLCRHFFRADQSSSCDPAHRHRCITVKIIPINGPVFGYSGA